MKINEVIAVIEELAPLNLQETYDNSGLIIGDSNSEVNGVLITLDITEKVIDEAKNLNYNLIVSHHPIIFKPIKKINDNNLTGRCIIKAIKGNIAIYAAHTNIDNAHKGLNYFLSKLFRLNNLDILQPIDYKLLKLVVFVPNSHSEIVREAMFNVGAGFIGNYNSCSFNTQGIGTFKALEHSNPFVGKKNQLHNEPETRIETIIPQHLKTVVLKEMLAAHPYEEVAWDIYTLDNNFNAGSGIIGTLESKIDELEFLNIIKNVFKTNFIKHSNLRGKKIEKVAICGGAGGFLINAAIAKNADIFITGELKYHDYYLADNQIVLVECGHFETEVFIKELIFQQLNEKFPNFALRISSLNINPVNYL